MRKSELCCFLRSVVMVWRWWFVSPNKMALKNSSVHGGANKEDRSIRGSFQIQRDLDIKVTHNGRQSCLHRLIFHVHVVSRSTFQPTCLLPSNPTTLYDFLKCPLFSTSEHRLWMTSKLSIIQVGVCKKTQWIAQFSYLTAQFRGDKAEM